jgi:ABC-type sugar transport system ATPase subunit
VPQELNVFPDLDVLANLFTLREPRRGPFVNRAEMAARARPVVEELGLDVDLRTPVAELSLAQRQLVEIGKALLTDPRILILDEPTSALGAASTEILRVLRDREVGVVFVSHILEDVMALCDEVTVLRDGEVTMAAEPRDGLTVPAIVTAMLGKPPEEAEKEAAETPDAELREQVAEALEVSDAAGRLEIRGVNVGGRLRDFSLRVSPGEIVGLAGVAGAGHQQVLELVCGMRRPDRGSVTLPNGRDVPPGLRRAIRSGVALVAGDRKRFGLMLDKPIWENIGQIRSVGLAADGPIVRSGRLRERARAQPEGLRIRTRSVDQTAGSLSGGNQQKVVFAKWLDAQPSVILLDDPTRGVDVGAKAEMHALIRSAAAAGAPVLICSTDIDELASLCDRVVVLYQGRVSAKLAGDALSTHAVLEAMNTDLAAA